MRIPARHFKVLLVDDSAAIQGSFGRLLGEIPEIDIVGFAEDVRGALSAIDKHEPHAVVLDVHLKAGDRGIEVLHYVRSLPLKSLVVVLSSIASEPLLAFYLASGADACFDKATQFIQARDWIAARVEEFR